jgi:hypothetical protein
MNSGHTNLMAWCSGDTNTAVKTMDVDALTLWHDGVWAEVPFVVYSGHD